MRVGAILGTVIILVGAGCSTPSSAPKHLGSTPGEASPDAAPTGVSGSGNPGTEGFPVLRDHFFAVYLRPGGVYDDRYGHFDGFSFRVTPVQSWDPFGHNVSALYGEQGMPDAAGGFRPGQFWLDRCLNPLWHQTDHTRSWAYADRNYSELMPVLPLVGLGTTHRAAVNLTYGNRNLVFSPTSNGSGTAHWESFLHIDGLAPRWESRPGVRVTFNASGVLPVEVEFSNSSVPYHLAIFENKGRPLEPCPDHGGDRLADPEGSVRYPMTRRMTARDPPLPVPMNRAYDAGMHTPAAQLPFYTYYKVRHPDLYVFDWTFYARIQVAEPQFNYDGPLWVFEFLSNETTNFAGLECMPSSGGLNTQNPAAGLLAVDGFFCTDFLYQSSNPSDIITDRGADGSPIPRDVSRMSIVPYDRWLNLSLGWIGERALPDDCTWTYTMPFSGGLVPVPDRIFGVIGCDSGSPDHQGSVWIDEPFGRIGSLSGPFEAGFLRTSRPSHLMMYGS